MYNEWFIKNGLGTPKKLNIKLNVDKLYKINVNVPGEAFPRISELSRIWDVPESAVQNYAQSLGYDRRELGKALSAELKKRGYDGIEFIASKKYPKDFTSWGGNQIIVFDPKKVTVIQ